MRTSKESRHHVKVIYFVLAEEVGRVKVGITGDGLDRRFAGLASASPVPLRGIGLMRGTSKVETAIHRKFRHLRAHGEWFKMDADLEAFVGCMATDWPTFPVPDFVRLTARRREILDEWVVRAVGGWQPDDAPLGVDWECRCDGGDWYRAAIAGLKRWCEVKAIKAAKAART